MSLVVGKRWTTRRLVLPAILVVATVLRLLFLDRKSLWYDETAAMRLACTESPMALVQLIQQIDATRGLLHPLILQGWFQVFGVSAWSARFFSVICGVLTVALAYRIGRRAFDKPTALWGAWLCAISPLLVTYSQEARMYAWLGLMSALAWDLLLSFRRSAPWGKQVAFGVCLTALGYSHPLGLFMVVALAAGYWANWRSFRLSPRNWLLIQMGFMACVLPWLPRYFDHSPEAPPTPFRAPYYLVNWLVHLTGGRTILLPLWFGLIAFGLWTRSGGIPGRRRPNRHVGATSLLLWWWVPTLLLYAYSIARYSLMGYPRYTLYVGPAFLILVAHGLARLPKPLRLATALLSLVGAGWMMVHTTYHPYHEFKYNFRDVVAQIQRQDPSSPVIFVSPSPRDASIATRTATGARLIDNNFEALKYHLKDRPDLIFIPADEAGESHSLDHPSYWFVYFNKPGIISSPRLEELEQHYQSEGASSFGPLYFARYRRSAPPPLKAKVERPTR
ncbi:MAG: hypothetical protein JWN86_2662 [Planctomycetota bacterium]|nr:hypothetical protein [Planctomycetota bacterium]